MESIDWPRLKPYAECYPVQMTRVLPLAPGRFRVDSPARGYELRVISPQWAEARRKLTDDIAQRGFRRTQRFLSNLYHERTVPVDGDHVVYLTDRPGGTALFVTPQDVKTAILNLVALHRAMDGISYRCDVSEWPMKNRYGTWLRALNQGTQWIATERILNRSREQDPSTPILQTWLTRFEELGENAMDALQKAGYEELAGSAERRGDVAWNGYRLDALLRRPSGKVFTQQLRNPIRDSRLYDLATICHEICLQGHADGVQEAIDTYHAERPLSTAEQQVMRAFAAFPHHALTLLQLDKRGRSDQVQSEEWQANAQRHLDAANMLLKSHR